MPKTIADIYPSYETSVTRTEIHYVSDTDIKNERQFRLGQIDRRLGEPCKSTNGAYLNGWYSPCFDSYYVPADAVHLV